MTELCESYYADPKNGRLTVIAGRYGVGKTHAAKAVVLWANAVAMKIGPFVNRDGHAALPDAVCYSWPETLDVFKNGGWDLVDQMTGHSLLVIDDLGAEHDPSSVGVEKLCQILSKRERMWTIVTTNVPPAAWGEKFDRRVESRLFRNSVLVDMENTPDFSTQ